MPESLTWVEVNRAALQNNVRQMKTLTHTRVMAVVKADAYGHGAGEVARAVAQAGADWLGVARCDEGLRLRGNGLHLPILVLGYTPPVNLHEAALARLSITLCDLETAHACAQIGQALGRPISVQIKVDTGMGRLGVLPNAALEFVSAVSQLAGLTVEGLFTHFAGSDLADLTSAQAQLKQFEAIVATLTARGQRPPVIHAANSAAAFALPAARYDLVRMGIALYGLHPSDEVPCPPSFIPALTWKARVAQVKTLPAGHGVSYGAEYRTTQPERVAVIPVGYGDGFRRVPKNVNEVLLHGQRAKVLGRVCMDQIIVGVNHLPAVAPGDEVVLVGKQGEAEISAEAVARRWGTINYDVVTGIMARVERRYV